MAAPSPMDSLWLGELADAPAQLIPWTPSPSASPAPPPVPLSPAGVPMAGPKAGAALERRRLKNRECMRRARQRQREDLAGMRAAVARLETQYAELCLRSAPAIDAAASGSGSQRDETDARRKQRRYAAALELAKQLGAENLFLKAGLQQHAAWTQHVLRIAEVMAESSGEFDAAMRTLLQPLASSGAAAAKPGSVSASMSLGLNVADAHESEALFGFSPLDDAMVSRAIMDNAIETQRVCASLLAAVAARDPCASHRNALGWDVVQSVRGSLMEYMFTKSFADLDVHDAGHRMWVNDMQVDNFKRVKYNVRRLEVLQVVNPNVYILGRDVHAPGRSTVFRSLFIRFRTQVTREIPNGDRPPLKAHGFVIGSHSLNRDWSVAPSSDRPPPTGIDDGETLDWADITVVTEFLTVEDPSTGGMRHLIRWIGRTDYKSHADALRSAPDTLTVCLKTEMLLFQRPVLRVANSADD